MFIVVTLEDLILIQPKEFGGNHKEILIREISDKYLDRVLPDLGLVVAFYEIVKVGDAYIFPGDLKNSWGEATTKVTFNLVVFKPHFGETIVGKITNSTHEGLTVSLGFFQDIKIPCNMLPTPNVFDAKDNLWVWQYEGQNFFYEPGSDIRFKVADIVFKHEEAGEEELILDPNEREKTMRIVGQVDDADGLGNPFGLGVVDWWN